MMKGTNVNHVAKLLLVQTYHTYYVSNTFMKDTNDIFVKEKHSHNSQSPRYPFMKAQNFMIHHVKYICTYFCTCEICSKNLVLKKSGESNSL